MNDSVFEKLDCIRYYVPDLAEGVTYYHEKLGLEIAWKNEHEIAFVMADGISELVIQNTQKREETDIKVTSVRRTIQKIRQAGGQLVCGPFGIQIGECAVVQDPWGNTMVILDSIKGTFLTDEDGNIIGQKTGNSVS